MIRLFVVGVPSGGKDSLLDDVAGKVRGSATIVQRCASADELVAFVAAHGRRKRKVDVLDIFDHGKAGVQELTGKVLFQATTNKCDRLVGADVACALAPHLRETAHVRLLGCNVAAPNVPPKGGSGRLLLWQLAEALGAWRTAFGAIKSTTCDDFDGDGFLQRLEQTFLFSSLGAMDTNAPDKGERDDHLVVVRRDETCPPDA